MVIFRFIKMAAAAILYFKNFKFLTVGAVKRVEFLTVGTVKMFEILHCAKFYENRLNRG